MIKSAKQGDVISAYELAEKYMHGVWIKRDPIEAVYWYRKAAEAGLAVAQEKLAFALLSGNGVGSDSIEAVRWAHLAADQNLEGAQFLLAELYYQGKGVRKDLQKAIHYYQLSADAGNTRSLTRLGDMSIYAEGLQKDVYQGISYYQQAADMGDYYAAERLSALLEDKYCLYSAKTKLFGRYLKCVNRKVFHQNLLDKGAELTDKTNAGAYVYDSSKIINSSTHLLVESTESQKIARLQYRLLSKSSVHDSGDLIFQIKALLEKKYGRFRSQEGMKNVGALLFNWLLKDGVEINLRRKSPASSVNLEYVIPETLLQLERERALEKNRYKERLILADDEAM